MKMCLDCRSLNPAESVYCLQCGRPLQNWGRGRCASGHWNPAGARFCVQCGRAVTTIGARYLALGGISRLIALVCVLALAYLAMRNGGLIARIGSSLSVWAFARAESLSPGLMQHVYALGALLLLWLILAAVLPGAAGKALRQGAVHCIRWAWRLLWGGLCAVARLIR